MTKVTLLLQTTQNKIDPEFFDHPESLANKYGLHVENKFSKKMMIIRRVNSA